MKELWFKFLTAKTEEDLEMLAQESPVMAAAHRPDHQFFGGGDFTLILKISMKNPEKTS
jgi:hypothetical protein